MLDIKVIEEPNIVEVIFYKELKNSVVQEAHKFIQNLRTDKKIKLLSTMMNFDSFKSIKDSLMGIDLNSIKNIRTDKLAIVCDNRWFANIMTYEEKLNLIDEYKFFKENQREEAIAWLKS